MKVQLKSRLPLSFAVGALMSVLQAVPGVHSHLPFSVPVALETV